MKAIQRKLHSTCLEFLVALTRTIILPDLDTPALGQKAGAETSRALAATGMRSFMKKLDSRCAAMGIEHRPTCEAYSTQGCSHCSFVNENVKLHRVWCCPSNCRLHCGGGPLRGHHLVVPREEQANKTRCCSPSTLATLRGSRAAWRGCSGR